MVGSVPDTNRAAALSVAVAMATARLDGVAINPADLLGGLDTADALDAMTWLASLLAEHALHDTGPTMLRVIGRVAAYVDSTVAG
jgi:hypothetical protein